MGDMGDMGDTGDTGDIDDMGDRDKIECVLIFSGKGNQRVRRRERHNVK